MTRRLFSFFFFVFCTFSSIKVFAQNYEIDIPEGFELIDTDDDGKGFMFFSSSALTYCVIRESSEYKSAQQALSSSIEKLKARASVKNIFCCKNGTCSRNSDERNKRHSHCHLLWRENSDFGGDLRFNRGFDKC